MSTELDLPSREFATPTPLAKSTQLGSELDDLSIVDLAAIVLRWRRPIILLPSLFAALVILIAALLPRTYTATVSFMPQAPKQASGLAGIAAQFGVNLPLLTAEGGESPAFYVSLIRDRVVLSAVAASQYVVPSGDDTIRGTLADIYRVRGRSPLLRLDKAVERLDRDLTVDASQKTSIVTISVHAKDPALAAAIAARILEEVNEFNFKKRTSQAAAERRFTEQRVSEAQTELRRAEDALAAFLQQNRDFRNSPQLLFQEQRLERMVTFRQQIYTNLAQSLELARIEEVRNTPVITIIRPPQAPVRPDRRHLLVKGLAALFCGLIIVGVVVLGLELLTRARLASPVQFDRLRQLSRDTAADLTHPWRLLRRS